MTNAALKAIAKTLQGGERSSDRAARIEKDKFCVLLPDASGEPLDAVGHKIRSAVNAALKPYPPVSVSVGVALFSKIDRDFPKMIEAADSLMYRAKKTGKNAVATRVFLPKSASHATSQRGSP